MYIIQNGKEFVQSFNPKNGDTRWTKDRNLAMRFGERETALNYADGIGKVVKES